MKTNEEMTQKNIELSAEFSRYLFERIKSNRKTLAARRSLAVAEYA